MVMCTRQICCCTDCFIPTSFGYHGNGQILLLERFNFILLMSVVAHLVKRLYSELGVAGSNPARKEVKRRISLIIMIYALRLQRLYSVHFRFSM